MLVVWHLDRLARSLSNLIKLVNRLAEQGIAFKSLTEQIDTSSATGKLVFHIFGALAEFERNLIKERTLAGLSAARARGRLGDAPASIPNRERSPWPANFTRINQTQYRRTAKPSVSRRQPCTAM